MGKTEGNDSRQSPPQNILSFLLKYTIHLIYIPLKYLKDTECGTEVKFLKADETRCRLNGYS